eukprot:CAMPEP_0196824980 /NCGR_PEP_ID=MMETSP1362-20130617/92795_1 /TAXON_ID=163516 /ORGANISM="Leptocylindrus danicus, Strain CCMP1856" /LENGTH=256 /DNA_ID=CAMNT_0042205343 /DNA_START=130 /DNA_END=900 /DNA_ORIENTATION=-
MQEVEYWDEKFQQDIDDLQNLVHKALKTKAGSQQQQTLDEADRKLREANGTKRSYKFDLRLISNSTQRKSYEKQLKEHDAKFQSLVEQLQSFKSDAQKESLLQGADTGRTPEQEGDAMMNEARSTQDKTQTSLDRTKQLVAESKEIGQNTLATLEEQGAQIERIDAHADRTMENLGRADLLIKNFGKRMANDKFIQCCACINISLFVGVILFIVLKKSDDGDDDSSILSATRFLSLRGSQDNGGNSVDQYYDNLLD